jgi:dTDP-glucose pyrophosphorylase
MTSADNTYRTEAADSCCQQIVVGYVIKYSEQAGITDIGAILGNKRRDEIQKPLGKAVDHDKR